MLKIIVNSFFSSTVTLFLVGNETSARSKWTKCVREGRRQEIHDNASRNLNEIMSRNFPLGKLPKKTFFFGISFPNVFTHPPTPGFFVRFGKTKGEIWVEKGDFRGNLGGFWGVWTLFGNQPPHPPTFGKEIPKKSFFFGSFPNSILADGANKAVRRWWSSFKWWWSSKLTGLGSHHGGWY